MKIATSTAIRKTKRSTSTKMSTDFTITPITLEKRTKPGRYSFLSGLKNVLTRSGNENNLRNALFTDIKNPANSRGLSKYQNFKNVSGNRK
jgi:hypothetical protein